jgi:hypothetical protein
MKSPRVVSCSCSRTHELCQGVCVCERVGGDMHIDSSICIARPIGHWLCPEAADVSQFTSELNSFQRAFPVHAHCLHLLAEHHNVSTIRHVESQPFNQVYSRLQYVLATHNQQLPSLYGRALMLAYFSMRFSQQSASWCPPVKLAEAPQLGMLNSYEKPSVSYDSHMSSYSSRIVFALSRIHANRKVGPFI